MRRFLSLILITCCTVLLFSCASPANEGVLIIPSSANPSSSAVAETAETTDTGMLMPETQAHETETAAVETAVPDTDEAFDALAQAEQLLRDEDFLALLAQYAQTSADAQTAMAAAVLAYQHEGGIDPLPDVTDVLTEGPDDTVVYWTAGGSVWHVTDGCSALAKSKSVVSGSETKAITAGKTRVCKRCGA